jgi:hypothetical protein
MVMIPNAPRLGDMPKGEPIPDGLYHLRCDKATLKETGASSKTPGAPMVEAQLTVFGPDDQEEYHGRKVFENFMLTGEGMFRTRQFLEAGGLPEDAVIDDTDIFIGVETAAVVQVEKERKDPKTQQVYSARNRVARFLPIA